MKGKNKFLCFMVAVFVLPIAFLLVGCGEKDLKVESFEFVGCTTTYEDTDQFVVDGKLVLTMDDGSEAEIVLTRKMLESVPDLSTPGTKLVTYIYDGYRYTLTINVVESANTQNIRLAKTKLASVLSDYKASGGSISIDGEISSDFVAKLFGDESAGSEKLANFTINGNDFSDIDVIQALLDTLIETTLNSGNANIEDVLYREFANSGDEVLQDLLKVMNIETIEANYSIVDFAKYFVANNNIEDVYNSIMQQIIFAQEGSDEEFAEAIATAICEELGLDYDAVYAVCLSCIDDIKSLDTAGTLVATIISLLDYNNFVDAILPEENSYYVDMLAEVIFDKLHITTVDRKADIKEFLTSILSTVKDKDAMLSFVTGKTEIDYYDLLINKVLLLADNSYYVDLLSNLICQGLEIDSSEGKVKVDLFVKDLIGKIRTNEVNWEAKLDEFFTIVDDYSPIVITPQYISENIENKTIENILYLMAPYNYDYQFESGADTTKLDNLVSQYDNQYELAFKAVAHYVVYRDFDELEKADLPSMVDNLKTLDEQINNEYFELVETYYCYYMDSNYNWGFEVIAGILSSKYKNLANNFMQLSLDKQIAKDLVECIKGTKTINDVAMNVLDSVQTFVADNADDIETGIIELGTLYGFDMEKYINQYKDGQTLTIVRDFVDTYLFDSDSVTVNIADMGEDNWTSLYNSMITIAGLVDSITEKSVSETYSLLMAELSNMMTVIDEGGIEGFSVLAGDGYVPTMYVILANDILTSDMTLEEKVQKYLPLFIEKEDLVYYLYSDILGYTFEAVWDDEASIYIRQPDEEVYDDCIAFVDKYYDNFINNSPDFSWTEFRTDFDVLVNKYVDEDIKTTIDVAKELSWLVYWNALVGGEVDEDLAQVVRADVENMVKTYVESYKDELVSIITDYMSDILGATGYDENDKIIVNDKFYTAIQLWATNFVESYIDGNFDLNSSKTQLLDIMELYGDEYVVAGAEILRNLSGDLFADAKMIAKKWMELEEEEIKAELYEELIMDLVNIDYALYYCEEEDLNETVSLAQEFVDYCYDACLNDTLDLSDVAKRLFVLIKTVSTLPQTDKVNFYTTALPLLISFDIIDDYNEFMDGLIDINAITNGAITSIDYNKFVEDIFTEEFYKNLFVVSPVNSVFEFDSNGELLKETMTLVIDVNYSAVVVSLDASITIKLTISY